MCRGVNPVCKQSTQELDILTTGYDIMKATNISDLKKESKKSKLLFVSYYLRNNSQILINP